MEIFDKSITSINKSWHISQKIPEIFFLTDFGYFLKYFGLTIFSAITNSKFLIVLGLIFLKSLVDSLFVKLYQEKNYVFL